MSGCLALADNRGNPPGPSPKRDGEAVTGSPLNDPTNGRSAQRLASSALPKFAYTSAYTNAR